MLLRTPIAVVCALSVLANPSDAALRTAGTSRLALALLPKHPSGSAPPNDGIFPPAPVSSSTSSATGGGASSGSDLIAAVAALGLRESKKSQGSSWSASDAWEVPIKHVTTTTTTSEAAPLQPLATTDTAPPPRPAEGDSSEASSTATTNKSTSSSNLDPSMCFEFCNRRLVECHDAAAEGRTELEMREREMKRECGSAMHQQAEKLRGVLNKTEVSHAAERSMLHDALEESQRTLRVHNHFLSALMVRAIYADTSRESFRKELVQARQELQETQLALKEEQTRNFKEEQLQTRRGLDEERAKSFRNDVEEGSREFEETKTEAKPQKEMEQQVEGLRVQLHGARKEAREAKKRLERLQREIDTAARSATPHVPPVVAPVQTPSARRAHGTHQQAQNTNNRTTLADPTAIDSLHTMLYRIASRTNDAAWHSPTSARSLSKVSSLKHKNTPPPLAAAQPPRASPPRATSTVSSTSPPPGSPSISSVPALRESVGWDDHGRRVRESGEDVESIWLDATEDASEREVPSEENPMTCRFDGLKHTPLPSAGKRPAPTSMKSSSSASAQSPRQQRVKLELQRDIEARRSGRHSETSEQRDTFQHGTDTSSERGNRGSDGGEGGSWLQLCPGLIMVATILGVLYDVYGPEVSEGGGRGCDDSWCVASPFEYPSHPGSEEEDEEEDEDGVCGSKAVLTKKVHEIPQEAFHAIGESMARSICSSHLSASHLSASQLSHSHLSHSAATDNDDAHDDLATADGGCWRLAASVDDDEDTECEGERRNVLAESVGGKAPEGKRGCRVYREAEALSGNPNPLSPTLNSSYAVHSYYNLNSSYNAASEDCVLVASDDFSRVGSHDGGPPTAGAVPSSPALYRNSIARESIADDVSVGVSEAGSTPQHRISLGWLAVEEALQADYLSSGDEEA